MDFEFSADQDLLRGTVARFLAERAPVRPWVRSLLDDPRGVTDDVWRGLTGLGLPGLLVPERHGGAGCGMVDAAVVLEELGRAAHPGPWQSSAIGAVSAVLLAGGEDDHAALLPALADGSRVGAVALLEPGRRHRWRPPATRAEPAPGGWAVTGTKVHVADAVAADDLLVTASTPDGLAVLAVASDAPGVEVGHTPTADPTRKEGEVRLRAAPARRLAGADPEGATAEVVDRLVLAGVLDGVGAAGAALDLSVAYARERQQFGRAIGSFQAVQHLCADMLQAVELGRAAAYYAAWACDAADPAERHRAVTMAKAWAADAFARVGAGAVQVHGGIGFTWEHDVGLYYKRLLTLQHHLGGSSEHLEELARIVLD